MASPQVATTPGSAVESGTPGKLPAAKDKHCPFCNQAFTSSSLGRHLDLYIKEKNPKPPDGLHDINEIRRIRGHITRRHARGSSSKREDSTPNTASRPPSVHRDIPQPSPSLVSHIGDATGLEQRIRTKFNEASWHATGVIRDLPTPNRDQVGRGPPKIEAKRDVPRTWQGMIGHGQRRTIEEERDEAKAAELALKEVLSSIRAASATTGQPQLPFDFNPFSLSFPALCLHCLGTPQALFSGLPLSNLNTWPIDAPGDSQLEDVARHIQDCFRRWRIDCAVADAQMATESNAGLITNAHSQPHQNGYEDMLRVNAPKEPLRAQEEANLMRHLDDTHKQWKSLSEQHRQDAWRLEILRAYARSEKKRKETEQALERANQEIQSLKTQVDQLSRCQHPTEFLIRPPSTIPVSKESAREFERRGSGQWDYERLVDKWRGVVREKRKAQRAMGDVGALDGHGEIVNGDNGQEDGDGRSGKRRRVPSAMMERGMMDSTLDGHGSAQGMHIDGVDGNDAAGQAAFMSARRWE